MGWGWEGSQGDHLFPTSMDPKESKVLNSNLAFQIL